MRGTHKSPLAVGLASSVVPGSGQLMTGARSFGFVLLFSTAMTVAVVSFGLANSDSEGLITLVTNPDLILVLLAVNLVIAATRALAAMDAWHRAGGGFVRLGLAFLILFTLLPHAALSYVGLEARATILEVFPSQVTVAVASTTSTTSTTTSSTTTTTWPDEPLVPPIGFPTSSTTTTTTLPFGTDRLTFLLLGGDAGPGRNSLRTDSVMVATVDTGTGEAALFGLPRNMSGLSFSDGTPFPGLNQGILNEVYLYGQRNADRFGGPDPGVNAVRDIVEATVGLKIDHYVLVDMAGFSQLVDAMGGVTVNPDRSFVAPLYEDDPNEYEMITFQPGPQRLDGAHALAYSRSRTNSNDYSRMARQRCVIASLVDEATPLSLMTRLVGILDVVQNNVSTDIPSSMLPFLINFAPTVDANELIVIGLDIEYRDGTTGENGLPNADIPRIQSTVASVIAGDWEPSSPNDLAAAECG